MVCLKKAAVVVGGAKAREEASLLLLERRSGGHNAASHSHLDRDRQQVPPPTVPTQLQPSPEHAARVLTVRSYQVAYELPGVLTESTEHLRSDHDQRDLSRGHDVAVDP